jgi:hypothetical protein
LFVVATLGLFAMVVVLPNCATPGAGDLAHAANTRLERAMKKRATPTRARRDEFSRANRRECSEIERGA